MENRGLLVTILALLILNSVNSSIAQEYERVSAGNITIVDLNSDGSEKAVDQRRAEIKGAGKSEFTSRESKSIQYKG